MSKLIESQKIMKVTLKTILRDDSFQDDSVPDFSDVLSADRKRPGLYRVARRRVTDSTPLQVSNPRFSTTGPPPHPLATPTRVTPFEADLHVRTCTYPTCILLGPTAVHVLWRQEHRKRGGGFEVQPPDLTNPLSVDMNAQLLD